MELRRHGNNHVIKVRIEVSTFWHIMTEGRVVVVTSQHVVGVVDQSWRMRIHLGELRRPHSTIGILSLMHCEIGRPHSVMDNSLSEVPFLEIVSFVLLVSWVELRQEYHLIHKFSLFETLVNQQIIFLMHGSMTSLTGSLEHFEPSPQAITMSDEWVDYVAEL
jgi:hypothetical protein